MQIIRLFTALLCLVLLAACGNKGPVRPLETVQPNPVQAPELRQQGDALLLGWQLPATEQDKAPLVDIYRSSYDPQDQCPECFDRSTLLASINPELPQPAQLSGKRYLLFDRQLQAGTGYQYKLIVRDRDGELSRPVILRQSFSEPVPAPQQLSGEPRDSSVLLQWQASPLAPGDQLLGYLLYRYSGTAPQFYPLNAQPLTEPRYEDFSLKNGTRYHYRLRALVQRGKQQIESLASDELSVTPKAGI